VGGGGGGRGGGVCGGGRGGWFTPPPPPQMRLAWFPDCFATVDRHGYEATQKWVSATCWQKGAVQWCNSWIINEKSEFCTRTLAHAQKSGPLAQYPESAPVWRGVGMRNEGGRWDTGRAIQNAEAHLESLFLSVGPHGGSAIQDGCVVSLPVSCYYSACKLLDR